LVKRGLFFLILDRLFGVGEDFFGDEPGEYLARLGITPP
jgi:hypothetical protein